MKLTKEQIEKIRMYFAGIFAQTTSSSRGGVWVDQYHAIALCDMALESLEPKGGDLKSVQFQAALKPSAREAALEEALELIAQAPTYRCGACNWSGKEWSMCEVNGDDQCPKCGSTDIQDFESWEYAKEALRSNAPGKGADNA